MKTLLLASNGWYAIKVLPTIISKPIDQVRLAYIITASKAVDDLGYLKSHKEQMWGLGIKVIEIDIEEPGYEQKLVNIDVVYVEGGNTFYLLKAIRETGFDKVLSDLIDQGVVYVGTSAGSYIMCPTIDMSTWKHQIKPMFGLTDLTGLNYVPFLLTVHYTPEKEVYVREGMAETEYPVRILKDNQALLVKNDNIEFLGEGEEVILK